MLKELLGLYRRGIELVWLTAIASRSGPRSATAPSSSAALNYRHKVQKGALAMNRTLKFAAIALGIAAARHNWPCRRATERCDELASSHSITWDVPDIWSRPLTELTLGAIAQNVLKLVVLFIGVSFISDVFREIISRWKKG